MTRQATRLSPDASRWQVAEYVLAIVLGKRLTEALIAQIRGVGALIDWIRGRRPPGTRFGHSSENRIILGVAIALTAFEGVLVEIILRVIFGNAAWIWVVLGVHIYLVLMLLAVCAATYTRPHTIDENSVTLRAGLTTDVRIARDDIDAARVGHFPAFDRSSWKVTDDGTATIASGTANTRLDLATGTVIMVNGRELANCRTIYLNADEPRRITAQLTTMPALANRGPTPQSPHPDPTLTERSPGGRSSATLS